jgi:hypothetical protein
LLCGKGRREETMPPQQTALSRSSGTYAIRARTQEALVRSLLDELTRYAPADPRAIALREQLDEERRRLDELGEEHAQVA